MAHFSLDQDTQLAPEAFVGALTDFSDARLELWPNIDRSYFRVHQVAATSAEVTEGSKGIWERTRYDWSSPGTVRIEVLDSNTFRPGSYWHYTVRQRPEGGSHIHVDVRRDGRNARGFLVAGLLRLAGRRIIGGFLAETIRRLERRGPYHQSRTPAPMAGSQVGQPRS
jgi:hypothetical protein